MILEVKSEADMKMFGRKLGSRLVGGESIELVGDVGAGKTTLTKAIAEGFGVDEDVQSPSFTISRVYTAAHDLRLAHYDFYRLHDAGIMANELHESLSDSRTVTIIEWADIVGGVLPTKRLTITITTPDATTRHLQIRAIGEPSLRLLEALK